jgi:hypothetical protein
MSDELRQIDPADWNESLTEVRNGSQEPYLLGVSAVTGHRHGWQELRQRFHSALRAVPGVTSVAELRWETWEVNGNPSGEALCRAAAGVVDEFADRMRTAYEEMS